MPTYAVIENNFVTNIIVAENKESAEGVTGKTCVEYIDTSSIALGYIYDKEKNIFIDTSVDEE